MRPPGSSASAIRLSNRSLLNEHWKRKQRLKDSKLKKPPRPTPPPQETVRLKSELDGLVELDVEGDNFAQVPKNSTTQAQSETVSTTSKLSINRVTKITTTTTTQVKLAAKISPRPSGPAVKMGSSSWLSSEMAVFSRSKLTCRNAHLAGCLRPPLMVLLLAGLACRWVTCLSQTDPRPTIYSGQVSFGLLLSSHSNAGAELSGSASEPAVSSLLVRLATIGGEQNITGSLNGTLISDESRQRTVRRQIFEHPRRRSQPSQKRQRQPQPEVDNELALLGGQSSRPHEMGTCSQPIPDSLYAGMGAIWASHQANLVGDSNLNIGVYVYDSCNDLDVGQRQSVRIVSNVNAFQQTTCEAPRGSPISLTIAHGDNQLRAIQLLTSFRVPVISSREHFDLEDYQSLGFDQRRYLFSTAPSSRYLAAGALRFARRLVRRAGESPKLANQFHRMSSRNGLIVISRYLPSRFIHHLSETVPNQVNYEIVQSSQPIEEIRSLLAIESLLASNGPSAGSSSSTSSSAGSSNSDSSSQSASPTSGSDSARRRRRRAANKSDLDSASTRLETVATSATTTAGSISDSDEDLSSQNGSGNAEDSSNAGTSSKMLSPTILMFITPSEAIDLVTRLRNDLAEVSKYFALVVATRDDISPILKTIFHGGGSRLCSGKAFYTISPVAHEISEFSRYFRDTVQVEGEQSDHPLICEFARHQASSRTRADLDDSRAEPVIKAVWAAGAAFKAVYKRECGSNESTSGLGTTPVGTGSTSGNVGNVGNSAGTGTTSSLNGAGGRRDASGANQNNNNNNNNKETASCHAKLGKNLSMLVQRSLRRLDVTIGSTGLRALDGFRIKFDDQLELLTNRFSIKHINKECEIAELGSFTGLRQSALEIDRELFERSLESSMPDPWPVTPTTVSSGSPVSASSSPSQPSSIAATTSSSASVSAATSNSGTSEGTNSQTRSGSTEPSSSSGLGEPAGEEEETSGGEPDTNLETTSPKSRRNSKRLAAPSEIIERRPPGEITNSNQHSTPLGATFGYPTTTVTPGAGSSPITTSRIRQHQMFSTTTPTGATVAENTSPGALEPLQGLVDQVSEPVTDRPGAQATNQPAPHDRWRPSSGPMAGHRALNSHYITTTTGGPNTSGAVSRKSRPEIELEPTVGEFRAKATTSSPTFASSSARRSTGLVATPNMTTASSVKYDYVTLAPGRNRDISPETKMRILSANHSMRLTDEPYLALQNGLPVMPSTGSEIHHSNYEEQPMSLPVDDLQQQQHHNLHQQGTIRSSFRPNRSYLRLIYNGWFSLTILGANIVGALLTLYVLTFLLVKNCDGSLDGESQGTRSMHLLAIIVTFFGSTLFIVYPTPGLCLLRSSWHNVALALLFGSLIVDVMQLRSFRSLGLGGQPNRLNQLLTLVFVVAVQVSFELQRWRYESVNYVNFVQRNFGSPADDRRLAVLSGILAQQLNPLNSLNDQLTPISLKLSEQYQALLQEYCVQKTDDYLQSQVYIWFLLGLLVLLTISTPRSTRSHLKATSGHKKTTSSTDPSGLHKLGPISDPIEQMLSDSIQHQHHQNHYHHELGHSSHLVRLSNPSASNLFSVTLIATPIYCLSVLLYTYAPLSLNHDLIFSVTMVCLGFLVLIGIFLPILIRVHRYDGLAVARSPQSTGHHLGRGGPPLLTTTSHHNQSNAFAMFPEFASSGHRRPSSTSGESSTGSRRPFADTKESRRNLSNSLAKLAQLSQGSTEPEPNIVGATTLLNNIKQQQSAKQLDSEQHKLTDIETINVLDSHLVEQLRQGTSGQRRAALIHSPKANGEKRLVMLDIDPCCPRHGVAARMGPKPGPSSKATITHKSIRNSYQ